LSLKYLCIGLCETVYPSQAGARYEKGGEPWAWCGGCDRSFPLRKGYYQHDRGGRPTCVCCGRRLRTKSPISRRRNIRRTYIDAERYLGGDEAPQV